ncbi:hypothetical protein E0765_07100 [Sulfuricurvum sp. IAE1]|uniref:hypothetical protein n=1 Tax=Sulfuricurvum sp. IAE1 TaxID=2546102 RepID=UPI0010447376|nr:hypothetical protein [Sulfuricurvum sp. IAE1]TDA63594.1 hypothetical protein E0765_07100 [Sulfuricurvum sp. IAE1]
MKREIQLLFSALLIAPLVYILIGDYQSATITALGVSGAFTIWYYRDSIRGNERVMRVLRKIF